MANYQPYSAAKSAALDRAKAVNAMRADFAILNQYGPQAKRCRICREPFIDGVSVINRQGSRDRAVEAGGKTPGYVKEYWHLDCAHPNTFGIGDTTHVTTATDTQPQPQPQPTYTPDTDTVADIVAAVVAAINPTLTAHSAQTQTAIGILTDALTRTNANLAALHSDFETLKSTVQNSTPTEIHVTLTSLNNEVIVSKLPPIRHENFDWLLQTFMGLKSSGQDANIWITGPAGTGKTTVAKQLAECLVYTTGPKTGLPLEHSFCGAIMEAHELLGHLDANSNPVITPFRHLWTHGGFFLADECDASSEIATLALNAPLANGYAIFPGETMPTPRHPDFYMLASANTNGMGGDSTYIGRNKLDGAFLSRFPCQIPWPYDEKLEKLLTADNEWFDMCIKVRRALEIAPDFMITLRDMKSGAGLLASGMSRARVVQTIFGRIERQAPDIYRTTCAAARTFASTQTAV
jgi:hypothetical protein